MVSPPAGSGSNSGELSRRRIRRPHLRWLIATPLVVLVTFGVVTLLWVEHSHGLYTRSSQTKASLETGPALVHIFMETNDWSDTGLDQFLQHWKALPMREQKAAHQSYLFPRLHVTTPGADQLPAGHGGSRTGHRFGFDTPRPLAADRGHSGSAAAELIPTDTCLSACTFKAQPQDRRSRRRPPPRAPPG